MDLVILINPKCVFFSPILSFLGSFSSILFLDLSNNKLNEISAQIGLLATLTELHFSYNNVQKIPKVRGKGKERKEKIRKELKEIERN